MAINQAQVDHILSTASADDPEVRLLKLQDEVELLKTSIKRLLIDIRERMNDMDNPFNVSSAGCDQNLHAKVPDAKNGATENISSHPGLQNTQSGKGDAESESSTKEKAGSLQNLPDLFSGRSESDKADICGKGPESEFLRTPGQRNGAFPGTGNVIQDPGAPGESKVRVQKIFHLFSWTKKNTRLYGHDRVDLMLESYRAMGYISSESCSLVKDIARLMPSSIGEQHDITAAEYVRELYELNQILYPSDISLDRDMIEVFMHQLSPAEVQPGSVSLMNPGGDNPAIVRNKDRV